MLGLIRTQNTSNNRSEVKKGGVRTEQVDSFAECFPPDEWVGGGAMTEAGWRALVGTGRVTRQSLTGETHQRDAMAADPGEADTELSDDRLRMDVYELLHERAETERRWQFWRLAAGHAVVAAIILYALVTRNLRFVALTPILYGIVVLDGLKTSVRMLYLQQQLVELEAKLREREPLVNWVSEYGFFGRKKRIEVWDVDLNSVPETAQYALILFIYLSLIAVSLLTWRPLAPGSATTVVPASRTLLVAGYGTFSVLLAAIIGVGYMHYRRVSDRIETVVSVERAEQT